PSRVHLGIEPPPSETCHRRIHGEPSRRARGQIMNPYIRRTARIASRRRDGTTIGGNGHLVEVWAGCAKASHLPTGPIEPDELQFVVHCARLINKNAGP